METIEYRAPEFFENYTRWPEGPWKGVEPDKIQYPDPATGLPCLIVRNRFGALCGYVGVAEGHPWFGKPYSDPAVDVEVHGGLTFADSCDPDAPEQHGICHIPGPGEPDHVWWFGFDCAHYRDYTPGLSKGEWDVYRTVDYVKHENARLAEQLVTAAAPR